MTEELKHKAEEYVKKDGTETEKLLNSVKLSLTREEATVLIKCIKQSYIDGATEATKELGDECSPLLDKLYLGGLSPKQIALVEKMQDVLGV